MSLAMSRHSLLLRLLLFSSCLVLAVACAQTGIYHTVQPGQTLYRIAKTYEIDERKLAQVNRISDPTTIKVSQRIFIPGATQLRRVPAAITVKPASAVPPVYTAAPPLPVAPRPASKPAATVVKPVPPQPAKDSVFKAQAVSGLFIWPAKGRLLNKFGKHGQNTYKGIEIGVPAGTHVVAAAAGKVIFSGNAIRSYGNLIILEHSDGLFTVYGYNSKNLVALNNHVGQGDKIALSGSPPNGKSPRLHFEIRQGKAAVDPIFYLP